MTKLLKYLDDQITWWVTWWADNIKHKSTWVGLILSIILLCFFPYLIKICDIIFNSVITKELLMNIVKTPNILQIIITSLSGLAGFLVGYKHYNEDKNSKK